MGNPDPTWQSCPRSRDEKGWRLGNGLENNRGIPENWVTVGTGLCLYPRGRRGERAEGAGGMGGRHLVPEMKAGELVER